MGKTNGRLTLKQARESFGWTQQQLAEKSDLAQGQISELESGKTQQPEIATMRKLAQALRMDAFLSVAGLVFEEKQP